MNKVLDKERYEESMSKQIAKLIFVFGLSFILVMNMIVSVDAQGAVPTPTPFPTTTPIGFQEQPTLTQDSEIITWEQLGQSEIRLRGPYDSAVFLFGLPANWKLTGGTQLNLYLGTFINTGVTSTSQSGEIDQYQNPLLDRFIGGTLTVKLNDYTLGEISIDQIGDFEREIPIPLEAFNSPRADGLMVLNFLLDTGASCRDFYQINLTIRTQSNIVLPHDFILPDTDLAGFPSPIFQDSFIPDSAILVIPDQPSAAELQTALTIAAGLGNLSYGYLTLDITTYTALTTEQKMANHLIFVGKASSFSMPKELTFPLPVNGGEIQIEGSGPDDGFIQMINSPWSDAHVILLVTANTDQGAIRASQALSTGILRPNSTPNLVVVQQVRKDTVPATQPVDQSLTDLGYWQGSTLSGQGRHRDSYNFNIPLGWTVAPDANFEIVFNYSELLAYEGSGISVLVNGNPIGSIHMSEELTDQSYHRKQMIIPASVVVPGINRLDVEAYLTPLDECLPDDFEGLWVKIWPESTLHLPLSLASTELFSRFNLDFYPEPFIYNPSLENTAFVLMQNDLESWRAAIQIASFLGDQSNGQITTLSAFYGDEVPYEERTKYSFILIGLPSQMPFVEEMNYAMPAPFSIGSDVANGDFFQVDYLIPPDSPLGYIELFSSPWNADNVVLAILGNTQQGLNWASSTLVDPTLRPKLAGNYAEIIGRQVLTYDTRTSMSSSPVNYPPQVPTETTVAPTPSVVSTSYPPQTSIWVFPALIISLVLFVLILIVVIIRNWLQARSHSKAK